MKFLGSMAITIIVCWNLSTDNVLAWDADEHEWLADSAYHTVMRSCGVVSGDSGFVLTVGESDLFLPDNILQNSSFGRLCAKYAEDDLAGSRFHQRGRTILEQLGKLTGERIEEAWKRLSAFFGGTEAEIGDHYFHIPDFSARNVIEAYLLHHLMALYLADSAGQSDQHIYVHLRRALILEAAAQGYLADAFSAGHLLTPATDRLAWLHPRNTREAHNYYRHQGVFVINSRGDAWQTFGDKLLRWYTPTNRMVLEACRSSLMELMAVFFESGGFERSSVLEGWLDSIESDTYPGQSVSSWTAKHEGGDYYARLRMPTLLLLPMPVSATWSFRTQERDQNDMRKRFHYPQLHEEEYHDPDPENIDRRFLYRRSEIPDWLIPKPFRNSPPISPDTLIKSHRDWASVRWIQNRYFEPSYKGLLIHVGGQVLFKDDDGQPGGMFALGYGFCDDLILLRNVSIDVGIIPSAHETNRLLVFSSVGFGFPCPFPPFGLVKAIRTDMGAVYSRLSGRDDWGRLVSIGIDSRVWPLRFTNIGLTCRLKYEWIYLDQKLHGPAVEVILQ